VKKCYDYEKISAYIDGNLNNVDKLAFEEELSNNADLRKEYQEIKSVVTSLATFPEKTTSSDFLVNLNNKIDEYEASKESKWYRSIFKIFGERSPLELGLGAMTGVALIVITVISISTSSNDIGVDSSFSADDTTSKEEYDADGTADNSDENPDENGLEY